MTQVERAIVEAARIQAMRDNEIASKQAAVAALSKAVEESEATHALRDKAAAVLKEEIQVLAVIIYTYFHDIDCTYFHECMCNCDHECSDCHMRFSTHL